MSAVLRAQEPGASFLADVAPPLVQQFDLLVTAPGGVARLRELIFTLAIRGKLVPQEADDEPASTLLRQVAERKAQMFAEGALRRFDPPHFFDPADEPYALPPGWAWARFGEVSINRDGERVPVSSSDRASRAKLYDYYGASGAIDKIDGYLFDKTLLLIGEDGANLINRSTPIAFLAHGKYWVNNHAHVIDTTHANLMDYLKLYINAISLEAYVTGTAQPKMNQAKLNSIAIALPPLAEQPRIVARVDELIHLCDALEAKGRLEAEHHQQLLTTLLGTLTESRTPEELAVNWQRVADHFDLLLDRPAAVDTLEQVIRHLAVRGLLVPQDPTDQRAELLTSQIHAAAVQKPARAAARKAAPQLPAVDVGELPFVLPEGWAAPRFGDVAQISGGVTLGRKGATPKPLTLPYLRVANVQRWKLKLDAMKEVVIDESELPRYQLEDGDLLITEGGDWDKVGRTAIWRSELPVCLHQNHIFKARARTSAWTSAWGELYLNSDVARAYFAAAAKQTTNLASINMTELKHCAFPIPPLAEQARIVTRVDQLRRLCSDLRQRLAAGQAVQAHLADALVENIATA